MEEKELTDEEIDIMFAFARLFRVTAETLRAKKKGKVEESQARDAKSAQNLVGKQKTQAMDWM